MKNKHLVVKYYMDGNNEKQVVNQFKSKIVQQNDYYFAVFSNDRIKQQHAFIINKEEIPKDTYDKEFLFEAISMTRVNVRGYDNNHVICERNRDCFNGMETNGNITDLKVLIKVDYLPQVVRLIK